MTTQMITSCSLRRLFAVVALVAISSLLGCAGAGLDPPPQAASESQPPAGDLVQWRTISAGEEEAELTGKPAFYFYTADWCAPCVSLKNEVFSLPGVAEVIHRDFVPIEVLDRRREEARNEPDVDRVQIRFFVEVFPTLVVARPHRGHGITETGLLNESGVVRFLSESLAELAALEAESLAAQSNH